MTLFNMLEAPPFPLAISLENSINHAASREISAYIDVQINNYIFAENISNPKSAHFPA
jgi:hypothetical protein